MPPSSDIGGAAVRPGVTRLSGSWLPEVFPQAVDGRKANEGFALLWAQAYRGSERLDLRRPTGVFHRFEPKRL